MAYNTTGKSHSNGLAGEKQTKILIESGKLISFGQNPSVIKRGGTKHKEDLLVGGKYKLSAKARSQKSGTYDYVNTSRLGDLNNQKFTELKEYIRLVKNSEKDKGHTKETLEPIKTKTKKKFNSLAQAAMLSLSSGDLSKLIRESLDCYLSDSDFYFSITHQPRKSLIVFPANQHPLIKFLNENKDIDCYLNPGRGNTSASIVFKDSTGQDHNFSLRLRLVMNNGLGSLLAGKDVSKNANSLLVFKLQQDNPDTYIDQIPEEHKETIKL